LILADEPTGALDSKTAESVLSLFEELNRDGRTIVMVTHAHDVVRRAHRCITILDGRIIKDEAKRAMPSEDLSIAGQESKLGQQVASVMQ
jgi:putative ABC transport system ATP-binding protein